ncbi:diaminopimelate decarboxylase [Acinetobacter sp. YH12208]|uniref:diaminopimelate decarboxylase n=1 Tax=Acinetobacter sp. YH12208 TaxID=2601144 RepID=UPI0015D1EEC4|nr:diaminopimelate decarboxylase [Acinetobacter sp. YH12208]
MENLLTPAYILDKESLRNSIKKIIDSLNKNFNKNILSYSLKTNSLPYILKEIKEAEGYAEVVSSDEYELAKLVGFKTNKIVYNGPLKCKDTFLEALIGGSILNIETYREIEWLKLLPKNRTFNVGIRINIDLKEISPEDSKEDEDYSRFGFSYYTGELEKAIDEISKIGNIKIDGLHAHRTTLTRSINCYKKICEFIGLISNKFDLNLSYIDIGGGYYGIMNSKPTFDEYFSEIANSLSRYFDLDKTVIIVEPGNAIVASCFDFITSVIDVKKNRDFYVITTDGSRNDVDPFFKKSTYFYELLHETKKKSDVVSLQKICGCTCLEYDKLFTIENSHLLSVGDKIVFKSVGAYTMALSPLFIRFFPKIYLLDESQYTLIRDNWSAKDFYNIYDTKSSL